MTSIGDILLDVPGQAFWHGGAPKLRVGDLLEPGHVSTAVLQRYLGNTADYRPGVYLTTDREFARAWAATWAKRHGRAGVGALYRVRPLTTIVEDPDYEGLDVSWFTSAAAIEAVEETAVRLTEEQANSRALRYARWSDGTLAFDSDGFATEGPDAHPDVTLEALRLLPPWTEVWLPEAQEQIAEAIEQVNRGT